MNIVEQVKKGLEKSRFLDLEEAIVYIAQMALDGHEISAPSIVGDIQFAGKPREITPGAFRKAIDYLWGSRVLEARRKLGNGAGRPRVVYKVTESGTDVIEKLARLR